MSKPRCSNRQPRWRGVGTTNRRLSLETLESRQLLTTILPVQGGTTEFTSGGIDFLYIRANTDTRQTTQTVSDLQAVSTSMDEYYRRNSSDRAFVETFDITPVFDLPQTFTSLAQLTNAMWQAAVDGGYNLDDYTRFGYGFPNPQFSFGGGALGSGSALGGSMWVPDGVFSSGVDSASAGIIHESLHTLGLGHAENYEFQDQIFLGVSSGLVTGGVDPYNFLGSEGFAGAAADIAAYQKYFIGWLEASNVIVAPEDPTGVYRIYEYTGDTIPDDRTVGLQIGDESGAVWISYSPDQISPDLETTGVLAHYVNGAGSAVPRLLDLTPNSDQPYNPDFPGELGRQVRVDLWDAAATVGQRSAIPIEDFEFTPIATGGSGDARWVDVEVKSAHVAVVDTNLSQYDYDFGSASSVVAPGFNLISPETAGNIQWSGPVTAIDRGTTGSVSHVNRDFVTASSPTTLEHRVRNGVWRVTLVMGDRTVAHDDMGVRAEGQTITSDVDSPAGQFYYVDEAGGSATETTFDVTVTDGSLGLEFFDAGGVDPDWVLNQMSLEQVGVIGDTSADRFQYDLGPEPSAIELEFLTRQLISPTTSGDISWDGPVDGVSQSPSFFVEGQQFDLGDTGNGIAADDGATGTGYIMYSVEDVFERFAANPPTGGGNARQMVPVRFANGQWEYGDNLTNGWHAFSPAPGDRLLALVDFSADTITSLLGQTGQVNSINQGYDAGQLVFLADSWAGSPNDGEFEIVGVSGPGVSDANVDFISSSSTRTLEHAVENGIWRVTMTAGRGDSAIDNMQVRAEGSIVSSDVDVPLGNYYFVSAAGGTAGEASFEVVVTDGSLSLEFSDNGGAVPEWAVTSLTLERVGYIIDTSRSEFHYDAGAVFSTVESGFDLLSDDMISGDVTFSGSTDSRDRYRHAIASDPSKYNRDFVFADANRILEHKVSNGTWRVTMNMGDMINNNTNMGVRAEGQLITNDVDSLFSFTVDPPFSDIPFVSNAGGSLVPASFDVEVTDGSLSLELLGQWRLTRLSLQKVSIPGDYDFNGTVDTNDYHVWRESFGNELLVPGASADGNGDGVVSIADYTVWRDNLGTTAVPESTSWQTQAVDDTVASSTTWSWVGPVRQPALTDIAPDTVLNAEKIGPVHQNAELPQIVMIDGDSTSSAHSIIRQTSTISSRDAVFRLIGWGDELLGNALDQDDDAAAFPRQ